MPVHLAGWQFATLQIGSESADFWGLKSVEIIYANDTVNVGRQTILWSSEECLLPL